MENKFKNIIESFEETKNLVVADQTFQNESVSDYNLQCSFFGTLIFYKTDFQNLDLTGTMMINCQFHSCKFQNVTMRKCELWNSILKNCSIEQCNLTRTIFTKGTIQNCTILDSSLRASDFSEFNFVETKFNNNILDLISADSTKILKSDKCIEIDNCSNLGQFLRNINSND